MSYTSQGPGGIAHWADSVGEGVSGVDVPVAIVGPTDQPHCKKIEELLLFVIASLLQCDLAALKSATVPRMVEFLEYP